MYKKPLHLYNMHFSHIGPEPTPAEINGSFTFDFNGSKIVPS